MAVSLGLHVIEDHTPPSPLSSSLSSSTSSVDPGSGYNGSSRKREGGGCGGFTCPVPELSVLLKPILSIRQYITSLVDYVSSGKRHCTLLVTYINIYIYIQCILFTLFVYVYMYVY